MTYKKKNLFILVITLLFLVLSYKMAISKTLFLKSENTRLENRLNKVANAPRLLGQYQTSLSKLNSQLGYVGTKDRLSQDKILEVVENFCNENNTYLKEYSKTILNTDKAFNLETNIIEIDGPYTDIIKLIYELEYLKNVSKVNATYFIKEKDVSTKKIRLTASIYLQNINIK